MLSKLSTIVLLAFATSTVAAQGPGLPPGAERGPARGAPAAKMLLANTAELDLTDAQVVRLAAIARRAEGRNRAMRASVDSARARFGRSTPADSAARRQFRDRMRADMDRTREQRQADQRDAITVLTPDQQARAWEMVSRRSGGMGRGMRRGGMSRRGAMMPGRNRMNGERARRPSE